MVSARALGGVVRHGRRAALAAAGLSMALVGPAAMATAPAPATATPIQHVVVIFQENVSFDHYFGTYPVAANPAGEPAFQAAADTPTVNGLTDALLRNNPNAAQPQRLDRSQAMTCDMDHGYTSEQKAVDGGLMDKFVQSTAGGGCTDKSVVMDYYDGNTVTAMWNYAQHFAMNDNSFGTTYGPSTPGALNLVAGQTAGAAPANVPGKVNNGVVISDLDPSYDDCSKGTTASLSGKNIGDLLSAAGVTWGWFEGGFRPTGTDPSGKAVCGSSNTNLAGAKVTDYIPHHEPFQYYASTANPHHVAPSSVGAIGTADPANHQYDLSDFWAAVDNGNMPAVSFLKASAYQDGHAGYSDPLDEQAFVANTINRLEASKAWSSTAVIISYDDSDGWYDHVMAPVLMQSGDPAHDALLGTTGLCGSAANAATQDRCGYGPRLPLLVISPFARVNFVDHTLTDQSSILRFIEDNWHLGRIGGGSSDAMAGSLLGMFDFSAPRALPLILDPSTGEAVHGGSRPLSAEAVSALGNLLPWQQQWLETGGASGVQGQ